MTISPKILPYEPVPAATRRVVILAFENAQLLDISGPGQVFASAAEDQPGAYTIQFASLCGGPLRTTAGLPVVTEPIAGIEAAPHIFMVAGGQGVGRAARDPALLSEVQRLARAATRLCSVCTGAWLLAAAGLLTGRRVTTHWQFAATLQQHHASLQVDADPIFIRDGRIWTSAGVTAGIDLALALVEADLGRAAALRIARHLVVFFRRPGGQAQFSAPLALQAASPTFDDLHAWILSNLAADLRVETLAARAGMSPRTFARHYAASTGQTPARAVTRLRLEAARRALESGTAVKATAATHGFAAVEHFRRVFVETYGVSPAAYAATHTSKAMVSV